jgi:hypothetical protein
MATAADAIAVPPMPVKWTDLISDENIAGKINRQDAKAQSFLSLRAFGGRHTCGPAIVILLENLQMY